MLKELNRALTFSPHIVVLLLLMALVLWAGLLSPPGWSLGKQPNGDAVMLEGQDWTSAERWAWSEIKQGHRADFNKRDHCGSQFDPKKKEDQPDKCRLLSSRFLEVLLTRAPWWEAVPFAGVQIANTQIEGDLNLENAKLVRPIKISGSRIDGTITLRHVRTNSVISFDSSLFNGDFNASGLRSESDLYLNGGTTFNGRVELNSADINSDVDMTGADIGQTLDAAFLKVGGSLTMASDEQHKASFKDVILLGAKVTEQIDMTGASIDGKLDGNSLQVGDVRMSSEGKNKASFEDVTLRLAKVTGQIELIGASVDGKLDGDSLQVGDLLMYSDGENKASFKDVILGGAKVTGLLDMIGASIDGTLDGSSLQVGSDLNMRDVHGDRAQMPFAHIGSNLDIRRATFAHLDLSGAVVNGDFRLGGPYGSRPWSEKNGKPGSLNLRSAHIGSLADAKDAWPELGHLYLDGFSFANLGSGIENTGQEMRERGMKWWDKNWARLAGYTPGPYAQLSAALTNSGDRQLAEEIRYLGREAERADEWEKREWGTWLFRTALCYLAGYGIGLYTFRVLWWVLGLSVMFAALLWWLSPAAREKHRGCASLSRFCRSINKEFADFFNDPTRDRLKLWPSMLFSALGVLGWLLAAVLIVAVSGLTHSA